MEQVNIDKERFPKIKPLYIVAISIFFLIFIWLWVLIFPKLIVKKTSCSEILPQKNGYYTIYPDGKNHIKAYCSFVDGTAWTIINPQVDKKWLTYLKSPKYNEGEKGYLYSSSCVSWRDWFVLSLPQTQFATSEDCQTITKANQIYRATGNYYDCLWWAGNRPTDVYYNGPYNFYRPTSPDSKYVNDQGRCWDCKGDWWNTAPSIGANGSHCVAYTSATSATISSTISATPTISQIPATQAAARQDLEPISSQKYTPIKDNLGNTWYIQKNNDYLCEPNSGNAVCNLMKEEASGVAKLVGMVKNLKIGSGLLKFIPSDKLISYSAYGDHGGTYSRLFSLNVDTLEAKEILAFYWSAIDTCNDYRIESPEKTLYIINCPQGWKSTINIAKQGMFVADKNSQTAREITSSFNPPFKVDLKVEDNVDFENTANFVLNDTHVYFDFANEKLSH